VKYEGVSAGLAIERPAAAVVVLRLTGWDTGEFGDAAMKEIAKDFAAGKPLQLFIDARAVKGASVDVSNTDAAAFDASVGSAVNSGNSGSGS
jgi:hypothetical protein